MSNVLKNPRLLPAIIFLLYGIASSHFTSGQCTATSTTNPVRVVDSAAPGGAYSFSNPANAILSDNIRSSASAILSLLNGQTDYLKASNFGFAIPLSAIICGIQVEVEKSATGIGHVLVLESYVTDLTVSLVKNDVIVGANKATGTHWSNSDSYSSYGSSGDIWGATLIPADINSPNFGVVFAADLHGLVSLIPNALIDNIRITVYYNDALLPITILYFNASSNNKTVSLHWKTDEQNGQTAFTLQRSTDGNKWETVPGASINRNAVANSFDAEDYSPYTGTSYYRLKMTSASGKEYYSAHKSVAFTESPGIKVFPNPFSNHVQLTGIKPGDRIVLADEYGRQLPLPAISATAGNIRLDVSHLKPGIYFIQAGKATMKIQKI